MHELGLARNIVAIVSEAAGTREIRGITLEIGRHSGVMIEALVFCFPLVAEGTAAARAKLDIVTIEGVGLCGACGAEFAMPELFTPCACGGRAASRLSGDEFKVKSIELGEQFQEKCRGKAAS